MHAVYIVLIPMVMYSGDLSSADCLDLKIDIKVSIVGTKYAIMKVSIVGSEIILWQKDIKIHLETKC